MASLERDRIARFSVNALRYALGPFGGLVLPWLVIQRGSLEVWGQVVTPMILVQLSVHVLAWGNKDFLLRAFNRAGSDVDALWRENFRTRGPFIALVLVPLLILPAAGIAPVWTFLWCLSLFVTNAIEPLIIQRRRFTAAFTADLCGLLVQLALIVGTGSVDLPSVCRSLATGQAIRALLLAWVAGAGPLIVPSPRKDLRSFTPRYRSHIAAAAPFFLIGLSGLLGSRIDLYVLNMLEERQQAGMYQVISGLFLQFQVLPGLIAMPFTRELYRLERSSMVRASGRLAGLGGLLMLPFTAVAWLLFDRVFHFDLHWTVYLAGALAAWPAYAYVPLINLLFKHHEERSVMWSGFAAATLVLLLSFLLVPGLGIRGALFAAAAGQWSTLFMLIHASRRSHALTTPAHEE